MQRSLFIASACCLLLLGTGKAWASDPYVGASVGAFNIGTGVSKKAVTGGFIQVGDDFSQYLGGELRVGLSGRANQGGNAGAKSRIDFFGAAFVKPKYDFNDRWMGYALLGVATLRASYSEPGLATQKKTRTGYAYGLGLQYRPAENYAAGIEYSHMLSKPKTSAASIQTAFAGVEASVFTVGFKYYLY
jgi:opacity protein-like surface antigen